MAKAADRLTSILEPDRARVGPVGFCRVSVNQLAVAVLNLCPGALAYLRRSGPCPKSQRQGGRSRLSGPNHGRNPRAGELGLGFGPGSGASSRADHSERRAPLAGPQDTYREAWRSSAWDSHPFAAMGEP